MPTNRTQHISELYRVFSKIDTPDLARRFLIDILTPQELESIAERWQILKKLALGMPQRNVSETLGVSISKVTRGSKVIRYGEGGFRRVYEKLFRRTGRQPFLTV